MVKVRQIVLVIISLIVIIGCNESTPPLDNSVGASANEYGYYGKNIIFGSSKIVGEWIIFDKFSDYSVTLKFEEDSNITQKEEYSINDTKYGVSIYGDIIDTNILSKYTQIRYIKTFDDYTIVENEDGTTNSLSCMSIDLYIDDNKKYQNLLMCPFNSISID